MKLYCLENLSSLPGVLSSSEYEIGQDVLVAFNYLVYTKIKLTFDRHRVFFGDDLLEPEDYWELHRHVDRFCAVWYARKVHDPTLYHGFSFGDLTSGVLSRKYFLPILIKYGEIIRKSIERWPSCTLVIHDLCAKGISHCEIEEEYQQCFSKELLVTEVCRQKAIAAKFITPPQSFVFPDFKGGVNWQGYTSLVQKLKSISRTALKSVLNTYGAAIGSLFRGNKIYFSNYHNLQSVMMHGNKAFILKSFGSASLKMHTLFKGYRYYDFQDEYYVLDSTERCFLERLKQVLAETHAASNQEYMFNGINYHAIFLKAELDLVHRVIPALLLYLGKARKVIRRLGIRVVIDIDLLDARSRMVWLACKLEGARIGFLDHGLMGHKKALKCVRLLEPDFVLAAGRQDPFEFQADRVIVGSPSLDPYPSSNRRKIKGLKSVLFLTFEDNFYARLDRFGYHEKYYEELLAISESLVEEGINILYRPHPADSIEYHHWLFRSLGIDPSMIKFERGGSFAEVLLKADLVISNVSTCYYEALAAGVPVVFFEPKFIEDAVQFPFSGRHFEDVIRFESGHYLSKFIQACYKDEEYFRASFQKQFSSEMEFYTGALDGNSGARVVQYVSSLNEGLEVLPTRLTNIK